LDGFYDFKNGGFNYVIDPDKYDSWLKLSKKGWASPLMKNESWMNDWRGAEVFSAAYLMGTLNFGQNFTLLGGARLESYNMKYHAQFTHTIHSVYGDAASTYNGSVIYEKDNPDTSNLYHVIPYDACNVDRTDNDIFPNVQLKYDINNWSDIRVAYTTGISRPDYTAIIPKVEFRNGAFQLGNPKLRPSKAQAFDIIGSFHNNEIGLFTIDFFYKEIEMRRER